MSRTRPLLSFGARRLLIGVVHLEPLPGAPCFSGELEAVLDAARRDARALQEGGCDAVIVENFGDRPFFAGSVPPETVAAMALCLAAVGEAAPGVALGVNVLRNDARSALGLCSATEGSFLRVNVHAGAAVTDQGIIEGRAAESLRERARLCPAALILADVHVKHATPMGSASLAEAAAEVLGRGLADAAIVTGRGTGCAPEAAALKELRRALPAARLLLGSGLTEQNAAELCAHVDGAIAGTSIKREGRIELPVDVDRVSRLRAALD